MSIQSIQNLNSTTTINSVKVTRSCVLNLTQRSHVVRVRSFLIDSLTPLLSLVLCNRTAHIHIHNFVTWHMLNYILALLSIIDVINWFRIWIEFIFSTFFNVLAEEDVEFWRKVLFCFVVVDDGITFIFFQRIIQTQALLEKIESVLSLNHHHRSSNLQNYFLVFFNRNWFSNEN